MAKKLDTSVKYLGDRFDFWNTHFNPITGYKVPPNYNDGKNTQYKLNAEY